jgi:homoserine dehydrogenase
MRIAILGNGSVTRSLLPLLARDDRFAVAGIHSRSKPAAVSFEDFLDQSGADVLVELTTLNPMTGEPAISHIRAAFARNMHVVTANKGPIAHAFHELSREAIERKLDLRFESSVMDGAPVFNQFRNNLPGVQVLGITGVLNSTSKLVIEEMEKGGSFEDGLAYARKLGVAEADASYDTEGWDSATKTAALANVLMDARVTPQQVEREGITGWTPDRVQALAREGKSVRLVSRAWRSAERVMLMVQAEVLDNTDLLASGTGTSNVILFHTDRMGTFGTVSLSPGVEQTAYGVYSDLVDVLTRC